MANKPLLVEEAYYWNYAQHLDFSYLDHPPMVALLIKLGTFSWGNNEWGVRFIGLPCWLLTIFFSYRLTQAIQPGSGKYTILFLTILPFFFIHSLIITPDIPLILSWSASLFYLYKATVLNESTSWYKTGIWIGLGMLSKYTIVLLGLSTLVYLVFIPEMRKWFIKKEPYLTVFIAFLIFTPVIYWNAMHQWSSFLFQTSSRFHASDGSTFHWLIGLIILFFTPVGIIATLRLLTIDGKNNNRLIHSNTQMFLICYTFTPIVFFAIFSLFHQIKFNWIGPCVLAVIPWFSISMESSKKVLGMSIKGGWAITVIVVSIAYGLLLTIIFWHKPTSLALRVSNISFSWEKMSRQILQKGDEINIKYHEKPVIVALDKYNIASELVFYQNKFNKSNLIENTYHILGSGLFGLNSLMYKYWDNTSQANGKYVLLVSNRPYSFGAHEILKKTRKLSPVKSIYQSNAADSHEFFYQVVKMKS